MKKRGWWKANLTIKGNHVAHFNDPIYYIHGAFEMNLSLKKIQTTIIITRTYNSGISKIMNWGLLITIIINNKWLSIKMETGDGNI